MLESLFNKIAGWLATLFQPRPKRDLNTGDSSENSKIFTSSFFYGTPPVAAFVSLITYSSMLGICRSSLLNQKQNAWDGFY